MSEARTVEVAAARPSNAVRSHDHPMLEFGNLSFPKGRYVLGFSDGTDRSSCVIEHRIEGAALIERLLEKGSAQYACVVSSPISAYRRTHVSEDARQEIVWDRADLGDSPLFTPMILCTEPTNFTVDATRDGLHKLWHQQRVQLRRGSRLALGSVIRLKSSIQQLLSLRKDERLDEGRFVVEVKEEPFCFHVRMGEELHRFLSVPGPPIRAHILTHIVTACLARLQRDYGDDDGEAGWRSFDNLRSLAELLDHKGLTHWSDPEFFPEEVATSLYPHRLSTAALEPGRGG